MSVQKAFNKQAIAMVPLLAVEIELAPAFEANQMYCYTLRKIMDSSKCLTDMTAEELVSFQDGIYQSFKHKQWIS